MASPVDAHLMFVDGKTIRIRVSNPPPETYSLENFPDRVLFLRHLSQRGAIYVERDRRKGDLPVEQERRQRRH